MITHLTMGSYPSPIQKMMTKCHMDAWNDDFDLTGYESPFLILVKLNNKILAKLNPSNSAFVIV